MEKNAKIYVAGHTGLVGSSILRSLARNGYNNIVTKELNELDLTRQSETEDFFNNENIEYVFLSAAKVGGILANKTYPAQFYYINSMIANNVIHSAYKKGVKKLLFLGSSCIYPKLAEQPIREESLLTGPLEETNDAYALAKIGGLKMCEYYNREYKANFISAMPCNLYGINDNFNLETSHLLPALIRKFHEAKVSNAEFVTLWGTGKPYREFLFSDDLADALVFLMNNYNDSRHINIGSGIDNTISEIAEIVKEIIGFNGKIIYDSSKPDGTPRKILEVSRVKELGFSPKYSLKDGIKAVYKWLNETNFKSFV